ncbi:hypothetical protein DRO91_09335 [Candidatus Heimdallarchaeota archaeon]|nr:MAG: hypothetical protein DRO91_09335 [Candidatus Heimdallarchaeota archaeon]
MKALAEATATLIGTVIGAGIFAIPYVSAKAGFLTALVDIVLIGLLVMLMNLYVGEVCLRTKGIHQLTGYAAKYLGRWGRRLMAFSMVFGIYGALVAYLVGEGEALFAIFGFGSELLYSLIFFAVVCLIVYFGLKTIAKSELIFVPLMLAIIGVIFFVGFKHIDFGNLGEFSLKKIFVPYGVVLFAYGATAAIPEMREELLGKEKLLKKSIIIGMLTCMLIYAVFAMVVVGITGKATTEVATVGLGNVLGEAMLLFGNIFAVFAMFTCFITLAFALKGMYNYDYGLSDKLSWFLSCVIPLCLFFIVRKFVGFAKIIEVTGAIGLGLTGILVVLMAKKSEKLGNRRPEYRMPKNFILSFVIIALYVFGMLYAIGLRFF